MYKRYIFPVVYMVVLVFITVPSYAQDTNKLGMIKPYVKNAKIVGQGTLKFSFWNIYNATLYAPNGQWQPTAPYALQLIYFVATTGKKIADRTISEMRTQGVTDELQLADWHTQMVAIFPNVEKNMSLTGVYTQNGTTVFFRGNTPIGTITDPSFGYRFFNIWLGDNTSEPKLRKNLLGIQ